MPNYTNTTNLGQTAFIEVIQLASCYSTGIPDSHSISQVA